MKIKAEKVATRDRLFVLEGEEKMEIPVGNKMLRNAKGFLGR